MTSPGGVEMEIVKQKTGLLLFCCISYVTFLIWYWFSTNLLHIFFFKCQNCNDWRLTGLYTHYISLSARSADKSNARRPRYSVGLPSFPLPKGTRKIPFFIGKFSRTACTREMFIDLTERWLMIVMIESNAMRDNEAVIVGFNGGV